MSLRLQGNRDVRQLVSLHAAAGAIDRPGRRVEGVHANALVSGRNAQSHAARAAADVDHPRFGGHVDGIEQVPRPGIDPSVGEDTRPGNGGEEVFPITKHHLAGEVADFRDLAGLLDDVGDRRRPGLEVGPLRRPHPHRLAGLGELLAEPLVARVVDRGHQMPADREVDERRLEQIAGELGFAVLRQRHDGQVVGPRRHVGDAGGRQIARSGRPGRHRCVARMPIQEPCSDCRVGPIDRQRMRRLAAA